VPAADLRQVGFAEGEETVQGLGVELCREPGQLLPLGI
jgi:hypothetical protein